MQFIGILLLMVALLAPSAKITPEAELGDMPSGVVAWSGDTMAVARDKNVELWDAPMQGVPTLRATLTGGPKWNIGGLAFARDGKTLAAASIQTVNPQGIVPPVQAVVYRWNVQDGTALPPLVAADQVFPDGAALDLEYRPDGNALALTYQVNSLSCMRIQYALDLWDANGQAITLRPEAVPGFRTSVEAVAFSPDSRLMAVIYTSDTCVTDKMVIRVWDTATGEMKADLEYKAQTPIARVAFSPDGKWMVATRREDVYSGNGLAYIWSTDTFQKPKIRKLSLAVVRSLAFSPDGKWVAVGDVRGNLRLFDFATWTEAARQKAHAGAVLSLAFNADGTRIATAAEDGAKVWKVK